MPELENSQGRKERSFTNFLDIPQNPKQEGLRPERTYAGGDADEVIIVEGKKYRKKVCIMAGTRPYTEKEYYSHFTEDVGPGPGWDFRQGYFKDGWKKNLLTMEPSDLSDLPLYELVSLE